MYDGKKELLEDLFSGPCIIRPLLGTAECGLKLQVVL